MHRLLRGEGGLRLLPHDLWVPFLSLLLMQGADLERYEMSILRGSHLRYELNLAMHFHEMAILNF